MDCPVCRRQQWCPWDTVSHVSQRFRIPVRNRGSAPRRQAGVEHGRPHPPLGLHRPLAGAGSSSSDSSSGRQWQRGKYRNAADGAGAGRRGAPRAGAPYAAALRRAAVHAEGALPRRPCASAWNRASWQMFVRLPHKPWLSNMQLANMPALTAHKQSRGYKRSPTAARPHQF